jgi:5-methylcytosine-specific restriction protein A
MGNWTDDELRACVVAYLEMAEHDGQGVPYTKMDIYRELNAGPLSDRTVKSIEYRMQNISFVRQQMGAEWVAGLVPAANVGARVAGRIRDILLETDGPPELFEPTIDPGELDQRTSAIRKKGMHEAPEGRERAGKHKTEHNSYERDPAVRAWVLIESKGICELCGEPGPFEGMDGQPFLEVHHVAPLAVSRKDTIDNAVAICPNCHRRCHHSADREEAVEELYVNVPRLVRC